MKVEQIRETCIDASNVYYNHLAENNKGVYNINIRKIEKVGKDKLKLNISGRIFDEETLVFKDLSTNKEYTMDSIKIQVYDSDTNTVVIKPKTDIYSKMVNANVNDWIIVSDLKFLIERVREWYELNGKDIALPQESSSLNPPTNNIFFENERPSQEQIDALNIIFKKPLTYIWGAPGTGKTQFVLSYAILHYLANKKKVAIVAPTNHALEQIFRGVIKMTDKAGISRNKILRLGGPSKKFADEFPEVCEIIGLENQLLQVNKQVKIIEKILGVDESSKEILKIEEAIGYLIKLKSINEKSKKIDKKYSTNISKIENFELEQRQLELQLKSNKTEQQNLQKKRDSIVYALTSIFSKKIDFNSEIDKLINEQVVKENTLKKLEININGLKSKAEEAKLAVYKLKESLKSKFHLFDKKFNSFKLTKVSFSNIDKLKNLLNERVEKLENDSPVYESLLAEYDNLDRLALEEKYAKLIAEQERLANYSTELRLRNVSIVGATLDTYLYRYKEEKLNVDHIFLDEAGYSNIIKAITLFNQDVPVTFLGDHMQLPPVCEISKRDIQNNAKYRPVIVWDQSAIYLEDLFNHDHLDAIVHRYINGTKADFNQLVKSNLTGTFRFGSSLAKVLQQYVYPEGFSSKLDTETEIIVYHVQNPTHNQNGNRLNTAEVEAITSLVRNNFNEDSSVAVLAPYAAQVRALSNKLPDFQKQNKVLTVHKSQGQEWDTVIYSVCDIGNGKRPWFTDSENSLSNGLNNINTAISRAKKTLIVVCNPDEWNFFKGQLITGIVNVATQTIVYEN